MIKRFFKRLNVRLRKRKERIPKMNEYEKNITDIFMGLLRKKNSVLLVSNESKKLAIRNNSNIIVLDHGLLVLDINGKIHSILIPEILNNYLMREFNRIRNKKLYRTEVEVMNDINNDLKTILKKIKNETHTNTPIINNNTRQLITG